MNDREMLELAAKTAGLSPVTPYYGPNDEFYGKVIDDTGSVWNPLEDDGDAFRLAVKLGLVVCVMAEVGFTGIYLPAEHIGGKYDLIEHHNGDPYAATRRAIVLAAVEIGRTML